MHGMIFYANVNDENGFVLKILLSMPKFLLTKLANIKLWFKRIEAKKKRENRFIPN